MGFRYPLWPSTKIKMNSYSSSERTLLSVQISVYKYIYIYTNKCCTGLHLDEGISYNRLPNVTNKDGRLLMPNEYGSRLENNSIVMVDVHFEL